ncbi:hypothetical protein GS601_14495 [Myxacorys almedinensis A]|uniref:Uncharacterized protein n=2 Tax=Myxacorys TaxID=2056239 RepID=A0A8J7Z5J1_9CYAN|nr:hypothetical protein [Myxacorys almedinensis A]
MGKKTSRPFLLMAVMCSAVGVVLGGTSSWAESNQCLQQEVVTNQCLVQDPATKTVEGMGTGLLAGMGAAIGAMWSYKSKK